MFEEYLNAFAGVGAAVTVIIAVVFFVFLCVGLKVLIEDAIDERRYKKHVRKVVFCEDCKYYEHEFDKSFCQKWQSNTGSKVFCSRGESKEGDQ